MKSCFFHPDAQIEFEEAVDYYEECNPGLGLDLVEEVMTTISQVLLHPKAWLALDGEIRRCQTCRFPFGIVYCEEENKVCSFWR